MFAGPLHAPHRQTMPAPAANALRLQGPDSIGRTQHATAGAAALIGERRPAFAPPAPVRAGRTEEELELIRLAGYASGELAAKLREALQGRALGYGRQAAVYGLGNCRALVLRAALAANAIGTPREREYPALQHGPLRLIPVQFSEPLRWMLDDPDAGLPRAVIVNAEHPYADAPYVTPAQIDAPGCEIPFRVLRKCPGERLGTIYSKAYDALTHAAAFGAVTDGSRAYREFVAAYLVSLHSLAALPQAAFDRALALLARLECCRDAVRIDMQHTGNMAVDYVDCRIGFFDFHFNIDAGTAHGVCRPRDFMNVLAGKRTPSEWSLLQNEHDRLAVTGYLRTIAAKLGTP